MVFKDTLVVMRQGQFWPGIDLSVNLNRKHTRNLKLQMDFEVFMKYYKQYLATPPPPYLEGVVRSRVAVVMDNCRQ